MLFNSCTELQSVAKLVTHSAKFWNFRDERRTTAKKKYCLPNFPPPPQSMLITLSGTMVISCLVNIVQGEGGKLHLLVPMCGTSCIFWRIPAIFAPSPLPNRAMLTDCSQNVFHTTTLNGGEGGRYELLTETHFLHKQTEDRVCRAFCKLVPHNSRG